MNCNLLLSEEVRAALCNKKPVIAMETGSFSHREGSRDNIADAIEIIGAVRDRGVIPAIVAVYDGKLRIGLSEEELVSFLEHDGIVKCNLRDICVAVVKNIHGATTISATIHAAVQAGISIIAAGGIGGVHFGVQETFDISPDLDSIAGFPGMVVCSGAKSVLDIPLTMEYLETRGVTVVGYQTEWLPAYYVRKSRIPLEHSCQNPGEAARLLMSKASICDKNGLILANPIREQIAQNEDKIEKAVTAALQLAKEQKINGKKITAFMIDEVEKVVGNSVADASFYIKRDNAVLASDIAIEYNKLLMMSN